MHPAPLFTNPLRPGNMSIDAAMSSAHTQAGSGKTKATVASSSDGAATKPLTSGSGPEIDASLRAHLETRRSACQSPSWEAYTQMKQEKKGAKREKELAMKQAKPKSRRLSKQPPPSSTYFSRSRQSTQSEWSIPNIPAPRHQSRDRSNSVLGINVHSEEQPPSRAPRSRSNSFGSLIRTTLNFRRPSIDLAPDAGFIGGIKLEQQRQSADDEPFNFDAYQAKGEDEMGIHPALRAEKSYNEPDSAGTGSKASTRSRYPPNSMRTSPFATTQALVSPSASSVPEPKMINKWRARVGLKAKQGHKRVEGGSVDWTSTMASTPGQLTSNPAARVSSPALLGPSRYSRDLGRRTHTGSESAIELPADAREAKLSTPPPPPPPTKSSKRRSFCSLDSPASFQGSLSRLQTVDKNPNAYANVSAGAAPRRASIDLGTSRPTILGGTKRSFKEAARSALGKGPGKPDDSVLAGKVTDNVGTSSTMPIARQSDQLRRLQTSSSEGSLYDEYHSAASATTTATTPDSSRPQSERGFFPSNSKAGDKKHLGSANPESSQITAPTLKDLAADDLESIHAAVQKVADAIPDQYSRSYNIDRRARSSSNNVPQLKAPARKPVNRSRNNVPMMAELPGDTSRTLPLRDTTQSKGQSPITSPWPASYLEAARKAVPAPPIPRNKPTGYPSPTLSTLSGISPPSPLSQLFPSGISDCTSGNHSPIKTSASSFAGSSTSFANGGSGASNEPLAKMFVECCGCRYFHDMPSKLYEAMSNPESALGGTGEFSHPLGMSMTVKCPWCQHDMSTKCCAGLAAMVYVKERLH